MDYSKVLELFFQRSDEIQTIAYFRLSLAAAVLAALAVVPQTKDIKRLGALLAIGWVGIDIAIVGLSIQIAKERLILGALLKNGSLKDPPDAAIKLAFTPMLWAPPIWETWLVDGAVTLFVLLAIWFLVRAQPNRK